jgi:hypothetical protein
MTETPNPPPQLTLLPATYGPPAVHVARFSATPIGAVTALTFFSFASSGVDQPLRVRPVFTAALTPADIRARLDIYVCGSLPATGSVTCGARTMAQTTYRYDARHQFLLRNSLTPRPAFAS